MDYKYKVLVYYHKSKYIDKYKELIEKSRKDIALLMCKNDEEIDKYIGEADIIFSGSTFPVNFLRKAKKLKWVQSMSAGVENFTSSGLIESNIILTKVKGVFGPIMSEYVIGHIFAITQNIKNIYENKRNKIWKQFVVSSIRNATIGIMGLGSVGAYIAYRLHLLGANVITIDEQEKRLPYIGQEYLIDDLYDFLVKPDFLIITLPLTSKTRNLIGENEFNIMKKNMYIFNISRSGIVQTEALIKALKSKKISGAVLDVFDKEPLPKDHELWTLDNVTITPHISGPSLPEDIVKVFLDNLVRFEKNKKLKGIVDLKKEY
jgi:phosphoglycerate dehydrogenase-like enzyme